MRDIMRKMCREYVALKQLALDPATEHRRKVLELELKSLDCQVRIASDIAAKAARVVYLTYRLDWESVSVGADLGITPPHVRKILWALRKAAARIEAERGGLMQENEKQTPKQDKKPAAVGTGSASQFPTLKPGEYQVVDISRRNGGCVARYKPRF